MLYQQYLKYLEKVINNFHDKIVVQTNQSNKSRGIQFKN